jgi:ubiquinone/menaquinone biosynthesis C-methylase UbiE
MNSSEKLNLGSGFDYRDGFINADKFPECSPDVLMDIEATPWVFETDQFSFLLMKHSLEHVGAEYGSFKKIIQEIYRVCRHEAAVEIHVPHYRHTSYFSDPTHVRVITENTFYLLSKRKNDEWIESKANYSMLAYDMKVNFEVIQMDAVPSNEYTKLFPDVTKEQRILDGLFKMNVYKEMRFLLKVIKPFI